MHNFSVKYLRCVCCKGNLELEVLQEHCEIDEGFFYCKNCNLTFPIISKIPVLWNDFASYISNRARLGGLLYMSANHKKMKAFLKKSLSKVKKSEDRTVLEERWTRIYQNSKRSKFYSVIKNRLVKMPKTTFALEHGCSVGTISDSMRKNNDIVFGIDRSFSAILTAKKSNSMHDNLDYFVADSILHPFGNKKFGLIVVLNLLELIEPKDLITLVSKQIRKGTLVLSDPYDYDRGKYSVKNPISPQVLRKELQKYGFSISLDTKKPSFIPWTLNFNSRIRLNYRVDLVVSKK